MWQQNYQPLMDCLGCSALAAAVPILVPLLLIGVFRKPVDVIATIYAYAF